LELWIYLRLVLVICDSVPNPMTETPAQLGYRWPAEWERQASVWLSWPRNPNTWPGHFEPVPGEFAQFVRLLAEDETVNVLAGGRDVVEQARSLVRDLKNVVLHDIPTNDAWCRDHGPTFLAEGSGFRVQGSGEVRGQKSEVSDERTECFGVGTADDQNPKSNPGAPGQNPKSFPPTQRLPPALIDWEYNAWGGKYPPFDLDNEVPRKIAELQGRRRFSPGIVLEGGAVEGNGKGTILTTKSCLLNPNRNPHLSQQRMESYLRDYLGATKILWLSGGEIAGDDTDGHIDQIARFVNANTVVVSVCDDPGDVNYEPTRQNVRELKTMIDQNGQALEIVPLALPGPLLCDDQRLPASYCNFLIANGVVIVPQFGDPADEAALSTLRPLFPDRDVRGSPSLGLVWGLGSFHCLSQQEPVG
jgi:agmatine deiminase